MFVTARVASGIGRGISHQEAAIWYVILNVVRINKWLVHANAEALKLQITGIVVFCVYRCIKDAIDCCICIPKYLIRIVCCPCNTWNCLTRRRDDHKYDKL